MPNKICAVSNPYIAKALVDLAKSKNIPKIDNSWENFSPFFSYFFVGDIQAEHDYFAFCSEGSDCFRQSTKITVDEMVKFIESYQTKQVATIMSQNKKRITFSLHYDEVKIDKLTLNSQDFKQIIAAWNRFNK